MFFILSKVLDFFISPLVWVILLLLLAIKTKSKSKQKRLLIASTVLLYLFSNQAIYHFFNQAWEVEPTAMAQLDEHYEVAIVLGGLMNFDEEHQQWIFHENSERVLNILPLYFGGQVDKILLSGGSGRLIEDGKEANVLANYLLQIGVKSDDLILEDQSRNTYENAKYSKQKIEDLQIEGKLLLSTSAVHMKRSLLCFEKQGLEVQAFSVDSRSANFEANPSTLFVPSPIVLSHWYWLIHEWVGVLTYKIMGYC